MAISVIIITHNEENNIAECLSCLGFADEVVVLDHASTDRTVEIAKSLGAVVYTTPDWPGFGPQKNRALALARCPWVLSLDADERVTQALQEEILTAVASGTYGMSGTSKVAYRLSRRSSYCGQWIDHSGWRPDWVLRLFCRGYARFSDDLVHEKLQSDGAIGQLHSPLLHLSFPDFESVLTKANHYSTASAHMMASRGQSTNLWCALGHGAWAFIRTYVLRRGFLEGQMGLALALSNAEGSYYRYAKLWLMTRQPAYRSNRTNQTNRTDQAH